jgi:hypothetical protein
VSTDAKAQALYESRDLKHAPPWSQLGDVTRSVWREMAALTRCAASSDGECCHPQCPQLRDNEPAKSGRHCPIDTWEERS